MDMVRTGTIASAPSIRRHRRPLAFFVHSLIGLKLSLFLGFVCLTGTIATVSHEIEWLVNPTVRATPVQGVENWGRMWEAVRSAYPDAHIQSISSYDRNNEPYFVRTASVELSSGERIDVHVDPGSARITGVSRGTNFHGFMRALHYYLFAPGAIPFYVVASMGIVLLVSLTTGLLTYKKFWRGFLRMPRWRRGLRTWLGDLHRLVGLWSIWFAAIIGLTCVWYIVERAGLDLESPIPKASVPMSRYSPTPDGAVIGRWTAIARRKMPGLDITGVVLPYSPGEPAVVQGQWSAWLVRERSNAAFFDPTTGAFIGARVAHKMPIGERIVHTADPLHFGNFGGLATKLIWVVFGLALTGMAASGAVIFVRRTADAAQLLRHVRSC